MELSNYEDVKKILQLYLAAAQNELRLQLLSTQEKGANRTITAKRGRHTATNDRSDYFWINVHQQGKNYWLTLFYNEVDERTGNIHTQIGRIQFWKNIIRKTPNGKTENGKWFIQKENSGEPSNGPVYIGAKNYDPFKIASDFWEFIECEQEATRKNKKSEEEFI